MALSTEQLQPDKLDKNFTVTKYEEQLQLQLVILVFYNGLAVEFKLSFGPLKPYMELKLKLVMLQ